jgi:hypothetical protein
MRSNSRFAVLATAASLVVAGLVGCAKNEKVSPHTNAILTDLQAGRLAQAHLDDTVGANPRDVVYMIPSYEGKGYLIGFNSVLDATQHPPKVARTVDVDHDGDMRDLSF